MKLMFALIMTTLVYIWYYEIKIELKYTRSLFVSKVNLLI